MHACSAPNHTSSHKSTFSIGDIRGAFEDLPLRIIIGFKELNP
jgi:hypothetical protein